MSLRVYICAFMWMPLSMYVPTVYGPPGVHTCVYLSEYMTLHLHFPFVHVLSMCMTLRVYIPSVCSVYFYISFFGYFFNFCISPPCISLSVCTSLLLHVPSLCRSFCMYVYPVCMSSPCECFFLLFLHAYLTSMHIFLCVYISPCACSFRLWFPFTRMSPSWVSPSICMTLPRVCPLRSNIAPYLCLLVYCPQGYVYIIVSLVAWIGSQVHGW